VREVVSQREERAIDLARPALLTDRVPAWK
jgi:hypothetical protein